MEEEEGVQVTLDMAKEVLAESLFFFSFFFLFLGRSECVVRDRPGSGHYLSVKSPLSLSLQCLFFLVSGLITLIPPNEILGLRVLAGCFEVR